MSNFLWKRNLFPLPLNPIYIEATSQWRGLYFIGEINPTSSRHHRWILTTTNYFTKWIEVVKTRKISYVVILKFLEEKILYRCCFPRIIITDNAKDFKSKKMISFFHDYHINLIHSTMYYPQGNGLVESSNKSLDRIIKKLLQDKKKDWHTKIIFSLWESRISTKKSIGTSPFQLVYITELIFPLLLGL